jgi:prophage regulatory protein
MRQILRRPEVLKQTGLSSPTQKRLEDAGQFPARLQLGPNSVGWFEDEVDAWLESRRVKPIDATAATSVSRNRPRKRGRYVRSEHHAA